MQVTSRAILHRRPESSSQVHYIALIVAALVLIALLDHETGDVPFQHLYYLPIILAAIEFGFPGGLMASLSSVLLYHLANPRLLHIHEFRQPDIVQVVLFFTVGLVAAKLADDASRMRLLSITDDLTGLHNLRSFESHLAILASQAKKEGSVLSVLVLDVDRLKSLNDCYGHLAGADAVRTVGHLIAQHLPRRAVACRYGGDEFVVAIPDCHMEQAVKIAEDLRLSVSNEQPVLATSTFPSGTLTISVGAASRLVGKDADLLAAGEELFRAADQALYRAKEMGRNSVSTHSGT
ncbi:MAG: sensor domain-containing diguanylate cyclase [Pyrinomonadaceae bacterium]|nr:sensor domain-containing diguanylate cyclase [Pyrinomonadaceae bacterium]